MTRRRDRQSELVVAVIVVSALAMALTFGIVLNLASRSSNDSATGTPSDNILIGDNPSPTLPTVTPQTIDTHTPTQPPDTPTYTPFPSPTDTLEPTQTIQPSATPEPTETPTQATTPTPEPSSISSPTQEPSPNPSIVVVVETLAPSASVTQIPTTVAPSATLTRQPSNTPRPTVTPTTLASRTPSPTASNTASPTVAPSSTSSPSVTPTPSPQAPTRTLWLTRLPSYHLHLPTWTPTLTPFPTATFTPFLMTIAPTRSCTPPDGWVPYRVKRGDILFEIALQSGISTDTLRQANCIEGSRIIVGQILYIPPTTALITPTTAYQRQNCTTATIQITSPLPGGRVGQVIIVRGIATTEFFDHYTLGLRADDEPQFQEVYRQYQAVVSEGILGTLPFNRPAGLYWLQLRVYNPWGDAVDSCEVPIIFN